MNTADSSLFPFRARVVRIGHDRCNEYDETSYMLAPGDWPTAKIESELNAARDELLADAKARQESPLRPPHAPPYGEHPHKTVAEVQTLHGEQTAAYKAWKDENKHLSRSYEERLRDRGFIALWDSEHDADTGMVDVDVDWGHNHGLDLNYRRHKGDDLDV